MFPSRHGAGLLATSISLALPARGMAEPSRPSLPDTEAPTSPAPSSYLSPAGVLAAGRHALFVGGDTELPGYPAVEIGWRVGLGDVADLGLELVGIDVAFLGRLHGKLRLWESPARTGFIGLRLRAEFKRHEQEVDPQVFRDIDDFGPILSPELSVGLRLGEHRRHAVYYGTYYYLDGDVRADMPIEHYYAPAMVGYELHLDAGLHVMLDAATFVELDNEETTGEWIPRVRLRLGWEL